ncbi:DUF4834 domain-containing protein [Flavobacterium sp. J372]|uniref:DUF4834 family protein n=1 Tax=Flavobacterium sp. J372 TaxID=2898436 RepID=UPI0021508111|nr:DUF4834 family protein [Flavobacterium sp. J372]MCR5862296.1 DUF4834 domain-containing protein [Flavobacterium sp. J372]
METASFNGVVRVIIIMVLGYYALKFLLRIFAPIIVQKVVQKAGETMYERQQEFYNAANQQAQQQQQPEKPREKKKIGEYIDFEEIE